MVEKVKMNRAMMDVANAIHQLGMAIYLMGESIDEDRNHGYNEYIRMAKENISHAEALI